MIWRIIIFIEKKTIDVIFDTLCQFGARSCYGFVDNAQSYIIDSIGKTKIKWVDVNSHSIAVYAASFDSHIKGGITVGVCMGGFESLSSINGILDATKNNTPLVLIVSQIMIDPDDLFLPRKIDIRSIYSSCAVFCEEVHSPDHAHRLTLLACQNALVRRGVAVIILPEQLAQAIVRSDSSPVLPFPNPETLPSDLELRGIIGLLGQGKRIGICAGYDCRNAHDQLVAIAAKLKAPIVFTPRAKDFVEYKNYFSVGTTGFKGTELGFITMIDFCDVLLLLGTDFPWASSESENFKILSLGSHTKIIQIDRDVHKLGSSHSVTLGVVGEIIPTLNALIPLLNERSDEEFLEHCLSSYKQSIHGFWKDNQLNHVDKINFKYLTSLLDYYTDDDAIFIAEGNLAVTWLLKNISMNGQRRTLTNITQKYLISPLSYIATFQNLYPKQQMIVILESEAIEEILGDLLVIIQARSSIKIIVFNEMLKRAFHFGPNIDNRSSGSRKKRTDYVKFSEMLGINCFSFDENSNLEDAVKNFLFTNGTCLLDVSSVQSMHYVDNISQLFLEQS